MIKVVLKRDYHRSNYQQIKKKLINMRTNQNLLQIYRKHMVPKKIKKKLINVSSKPTLLQQYRNQ